MPGPGEANNQTSSRPSPPAGSDGSSQERERRVFREVTDRLIQERRLGQANRVSTLGRLAATVAHEFNNVLMGIQPFAEVIVRLAGDERVEKAGTSIIGSVQRGRRITQEILQFARPAQPVKKRMDVREWIEQRATELRGLLSTAIQLTTNVEDSALFVMGDWEQLTQALTNLATNAREAMPQGGTLEIGARILSSLGETGSAGSPRNRVEIVVRDTGSGIHPDSLANLFEPFFTTRKGRTGLGLPIALQVIKQHGGTIEIESQLGVGTAFHLFLPAALAEGAAAETPRPDERVQKLFKKRILLVEDEPSVAAGIRSMLESAGLSVRSVTLGAQTIPAVEEELPDAVLLDVALPDMDGADVYRLISAKWPSLPVVFSTAHADQTELEGFLASPHVGFLRKPYDSENLISELTRVLSATAKREPPMP